jgi:hypothetical protein
MLIIENEFDFSRNREHDPRRPALDQEGRFAIVTNVGRDAMDALAARASVSCGRTAPVRTQRRVVLASRR